MNAIIKEREYFKPVSIELQKQSRSQVHGIEIVSPRPVFRMVALVRRFAGFFHRLVRTNIDENNMNNNAWLEVYRGTGKDRY